MIIGVGEVGHHILKALMDEKLYPPSLFLVDFDVVEPVNPSYDRRHAGQPKVIAVYHELLRQGYKLFLAQDFFTAPMDGVCFVSKMRFLPHYRPHHRWLVVECTDDAEMLSLNAIHVHTGLVSGRPAFEIRTGTVVGVKNPPHPPDFCREALSRAAQAAARRFVEFYQKGDFPSHTLEILEQEVRDDST